MDENDRLMATALFMGVVAVALLAFSAGFVLGAFL